MSTNLVESPCIKVCAIDGRSGLCLGCGRTLQEIAQWTKFSPSQRRAVMEQLEARLRNAQAHA